MKNIKQILFTFLVLLPFISNGQNSDAIFFKDSISSTYKLMSTSINSKKPKTFVLTNKKGTPTSYDFSNIHTLRFYASTKVKTTFRIIYFSGSTQSKPMEFNLEANTSGYITNKFVTPTESNNNNSFNYKEIDSIQIEVTSEENVFLIDELSFQYSDDSIIIDRPESLKKRLEEENTSFKNQKEKEGNSDFIKKEKAREAQRAR